MYTSELCRRKTNKQQYILQNLMLECSTGILRIYYKGAGECTCKSLVFKKITPYYAKHGLIKDEVCDMQQVGACT